MSDEDQPARARDAGYGGGRLGASAGGVVLLAVAVALAAPGTAAAAQAPVGLGTAAAFAVLGGAAVTNTGPSVVTGDLGVSPGSAITGMTPATVLGTQYAADAVAAQAQADLTVAYVDAAGRTPASNVSADLGGRTLTTGVYRSASALGLTGTLALDAEGDPDAVFIFQAGSTLITASGSRVTLIGGAQACNVVWQVGSSATLGTNSVIRGNVLALTSITATTGAVVNGRLLARNGAVTLDDNTITRAQCSPPVVAAPTTPASPGAPAVPGSPTTPATPGSPGSPGTPATPGSPGTPGTPGTPGSPGTPGTPATAPRPSSPGPSATRPGTPAPLLHEVTYVVRPGDTLSSIVRRFVLGPGAPARSVARTVTLVVRRNARALPNPNLIHIGLRLVLPPGGSSTSAPPTVSFPVTG